MKKRIVTLIVAVVLLCQVFTMAASAETQADWNTFYEGISQLKEDECFDITPREFYEKFNEKNSANGEWMEFVEEDGRCNLYWGKEQMNIFLQFLDTSQTEIQWQSGIERSKWNKVKVYIATNEMELDEYYLSSFSVWFDLLADALDISFPGDDVFMGKAKNTGDSIYPNLQYTDKNIKYTLQFYDDSIFYGEPTTVYAASIEIVR